jgi:hypothetical protein
MLDSSAIAFNSKGQLVNGQHRLSAVVKANKPIKFLVAFNIENHPEMDRGRARHISDNIKTDESLPDSIRESRDIQLVATSICRVMQKSYGIETEAVRNLLIKYGDKFQELDEAGILRISGGSRYRVVSAGMFAAYINGVDIDTLLRVKEVLIDGCCRDDSDKPIIGLRDKLLNQKGSGLALEVERFNYTTYCIWSVIKGHTSKKTSCKEPMYKVEIK